MGGGRAAGGKAANHGVAAAAWPPRPPKPPLSLSGLAVAWPSWAASMIVAVGVGV